MKEVWSDICDIKDIPSMGGVCALHQNQQVAIFNLDQLGDKCREGNRIKSISNFDPISKANVLSRGIVGDVDGRHVVSSPLLKQHFCLDTGECLEDSSFKVDVYSVRLRNNRVELKALSIE